jgi:hypothetical protein
MLLVVVIVFFLFGNLYSQLQWHAEHINALQCIILTHITNVDNKITNQTVVDLIETCVPVPPIPFLASVVDLFNIFPRGVSSLILYVSCVGFVLLVLYACSFTVIQPPARTVVADPPRSKSTIDTLIRSKRGRSKITIDTLVRSQ